LAHPYPFCLPGERAGDAIGLPVKNALIPRTYQPNRSRDESSWLKPRGTAEFLHRKRSAWRIDSNVTGDLHRKSTRDKNFTRTKVQRRIERIEESVARYLSELDSDPRCNV